MAMRYRIHGTRYLVTFVLLLAAAAYLVLVELHRGVRPSYDLYAYFMPNALHAARSFWEGGKGLLWNPFQSCGGPFFANGVTGLLYPPYLLFLVLEANTAVHAVLIINMLVGAVGMFLLARQLGLGQIAALGGALAFELGAPMSEFTGWSPMTNGPWAWLPWALLFCERLLRSPSRGGVVGLAAVLALQLLPGAVLIAALTFQLIALRVAWEIVTRSAERPWGSALAVAAGLALAPLLVAIQLLPNIEFARESIRVAGSAADIVNFYSPPVSRFLATTARRVPPVPFLIAPMLLAAVAPFVSATRRLAIFYILTAVLYGLFALGAATPLFGLYALLPPGAMVLRAPNRLFWMSGFSLAVLAAIGLDALTNGGSRPRTRWLRSMTAVGLAAALCGFAPGGLRWTEAAPLAVIVSAVLAASVYPGLKQPAVWIALVALVLNLAGTPLRYGGKLLPSAEGLWAHAQTFAALRPPITAQDRVLLMPSLAFAPSPQVGFEARTATVLRVPSLSDYETLPGRRFAEYLTMMRRGTSLGGLTDYYSPFPWVTPGVRRRLLDLASVRYLIASRSVDVETVLDLPRVPVSAPELRVYRNDTALPRARYVSRIEVVPDPSRLLNRLAYGSDDLTSVALVEEPMPSGFTGAAGPHRGGATRFLTNDPEHLAIEVDAPARGFLVLADSYYPGWRASVNGTAAPILRANYMFRLIDVPAGTSRVEFRFRPTSLAVGAIVSALTVVGLAALLVRGRVRRSP